MIGRHSLCSLWALLAYTQLALYRFTALWSIDSQDLGKSLSINIFLKKHLLIRRLIVQYKALCCWIVISHDDLSFKFVSHLSAFTLMQVCYALPLCPSEKYYLFVALERRSSCSVDIFRYNTLLTIRFERLYAFDTSPFHSAPWLLQNLPPSALCFSNDFRLSDTLLLRTNTLVIWLLAVQHFVTFERFPDYALALCLTLCHLRALFQLTHCDTEIYLLTN